MDLKFIAKQSDWDYIEKFINEYSMSSISHEKTKLMIDMMIAVLESKEYDFSLFESKKY